MNRAGNTRARRSRDREHGLPRAAGAWRRGRAARIPASRRGTAHRGARGSLAEPRLSAAMTSAASEIVWWGARNGRSASRPAPGAIRPATEWMAVASSASSNSRGGRMLWQPSRQHRLAGAGRSDHQQVMPPAAATSRAARERLTARSAAAGRGDSLGEAAAGAATPATDRSTG